MISEALKIIKENIAEAAAYSGRKPEDILLVGVTKTISIDRIKELIELGVRDLGENYVQEFLKKYEDVNANWHFIGHLQTNKIKYIVDKVCLIHSVDSMRLGMEISKYAIKLNKKVKILVEVNVAQEETKQGIPYNEAYNLVKELSHLNGICVEGLMAMPPYVENPEQNKSHFKKMHQLYVDINEKIHDNVKMKYLSMGMSNDYDVAIMEGANIVRIGTAIFGKR